MSEPAPAHLDLDALADALADDAADGTGHLAGCASCTSRLAELAAAESRVTGALAGLPAPGLPDDVAQRLTAALAAEPALSGSASASVTALPTRTARRRWLPAAAAAGVLMVSAAGLGLAFLPKGGGDELASGAGLPALPTSASGTDYADEAAVAQVLPGVLDGTAGRAYSESSGESATRSTARTDGNGGGGSAAQTEQQDSALTAQEPAPAAAGGDPLERLRGPEGLADCLSALLPPGEPDVQPLGLDYAQFAGAPALAVVLPDPDPGKVAVYVVGPGCTAQDESLLTFLRVDAP
jgi:hypothetical protein